jgi:hypothetical protein
MSNGSLIFFVILSIHEITAPREPHAFRLTHMHYTSVFFLFNIFSYKKSNFSLYKSTFKYHTRLILDVTSESYNIMCRLLLKFIQASFIDLL